MAWVGLVLGFLGVVGCLLFLTSVSQKGERELKRALQDNNAELWKSRLR